MGVYSDFLAGAKTVDTGTNASDDGYKVAGDKVAVRQLDKLKAIKDSNYVTGFAEADEVQSIAIYEDTIDGGNFTLTISLKGLPAFTTANIAHDANAATIEAAIDTAAAAASVPNFSAGDIAVTGGPLTTTPVVLTFDGASVDAQNHGLTVINDVDLTGGGSVGAVTTTTHGQSNRAALSILFSTSAITGTIPAQGVTPSDFTAASNHNTNWLLPDQDTLRRLAREAGHVDENLALEHAILDALDLPRR